MLFFTDTIENLQDLKKDENSIQSSLHAFDSIISDALEEHKIYYQKLQTLKNVDGQTSKFRRFQKFSMNKSSIPQFKIDKQLLLNQLFILEEQIFENLALQYLISGYFQTDLSKILELTETNRDVLTKFQNLKNAYDKKSTFNTPGHTYFYFFLGYLQEKINKVAQKFQPVITVSSASSSNMICNPSFIIFDKKLETLSESSTKTLEPKSRTRNALSENSTDSCKVVGAKIERSSPVSVEKRPHLLSEPVRHDSGASNESVNNNAGTLNRNRRVVKKNNISQMIKNSNMLVAPEQIQKVQAMESGSGSFGKVFEVKKHGQQMLRLIDTGQARKAIRYFDYTEALKQFCTQIVNWSNLKHDNLVLFTGITIMDKETQMKKSPPQSADINANFSLDETSLLQEQDRQLNSRLIGLENRSRPLCIGIMNQFVPHFETLDRKIQLMSLKIEYTEIAKMICQALAYLHSKGMSHQDLRAKNVFILDTGNHRQMVKIAEYSIRCLDLQDVNFDFFSQSALF